MAREFPPLNADDICRIIEVSGKAGVVELRVDDLHLRFGPNPAPRPIEHAPASAPVVKFPEDATSGPENLDEPPTDPEQMRQEMLRLEEEAKKAAEELARQVAFDELEMINPYEAEQMRARGEILNERTPGNE